MQNNKLYKILIPVLCFVLVLTEIVLSLLGVAIELNIIIEILAIIISCVFVFFLKEKKDFEKTREEIEKDIKDNIESVSNVIENIIDKKDEKE